ncbi:hypothetical protein [Cohnella fermenti]|uniref:Pilus assembly protein n=1 Tax=Cohnella fermenti TaxID=2565925 RepID=A0A4S4BJR9_9BACL|nr:hypothetical protein [Cohnella fermenti]THF74818.1 hypothetical protein E6C55_23830 [Cohnella fermenti]
MISMSSFKTGIRRWWANAEGSFVLEASLVFPVLLLISFLLLLFALYAGQGAIVYYETSAAAERAAFTWSNSAKELRTGAYPSGQYEGLYWRLAEDGLVSGLFGLATGSGDGMVTVAGAGTESGTEAGAGDGSEDGTGSGSGSGNSGSGLAERKLSAALRSLEASTAGEWSYRNSALVRKIVGEATSSAVPEALKRWLPAAAIHAEPAAVVVEPAEFIRTVDLIRYYGQKLRGAADGGSGAVGGEGGGEGGTDGDAYRSQAQAALAARLPS